jgi:peptidyl-prolyl cis-trans isomerase SurA
MKRARLVLPLAAILLMPAASCRRKAPTGVAAEVNSRPVTFEALDKQYGLQFPTPSPEVSEDQVAAQKLEVLGAMIDKEILFQRAEKLNLVAVDSDVEARFNEVKAPYTQEEFQKQLAAKKITADELKAQFRLELSISKLFNKEITAHISITDKDVTDYYNANKAGFNFPEPQIHMAQILVTPNPDPNVRNLKSDKAQDEQQAQAKIQMIDARLKKGEDFAMIAQSFSEDPNSAPNGGDMGYIPESALEQAHVDLRKTVVSLQPGQVSPPIKTAEGWRILKVIAREPAGQRELNDPRVQQQIRENLINRKDQLLKKIYFEIARNEARVVNYYAQSLLEKLQSGK